MPLPAPRMALAALRTAPRALCPSEAGEWQEGAFIPIPGMVHLYGLQDKERQEISQVAI